MRRITEIINRVIKLIVRTRQYHFTSFSVIHQVLGRYHASLIHYHHTVEYPITLNDLNSGGGTEKAFIKRREFEKRWNRNKKGG
ncbi:MAG: hypothetical protein B7Z54_08925 [Sphingobacteriales bacterium 12-47-4]|nr:MAG: hypothetical protein B7Z54_08925 [Sphingobacteriales bacterium 12-47-4]